MLVSGSIVVTDTSVSLVRSLAINISSGIGYAKYTVGHTRCLHLYDADRCSSIGAFWDAVHTCPILIWSPLTRIQPQIANEPSVNTSSTRHMTNSKSGGRKSQLLLQADKRCVAGKCQHRGERVVYHRPRTLGRWRESSEQLHRGNNSNHMNSLLDRKLTTLEVQWSTKSSLGSSVRTLESGPKWYSGVRKRDKQKNPKESPHQGIMHWLCHGTDRSCIWSDQYWWIIGE